MRVCIIHSIFPPYSRGGAEQVAFATASAFAQAGHDVFVITCAPFEGGKNFAGRWETMKKMRVFRFTPLNLFTIFNIGKYPALLRAIWHIIDMFNVHTYLVVKKILMREKPDLIITRNLKGLGYTVPLVIRRHAPKWFHGLHDLGALHPRGFMEWGKEAAIHKPNFLVRLYRMCARYLFGSPDAVIAPSQFVLDEYERAGFFQASKKVVIQNPIIPPLGGGVSPPSGGQSIALRFIYVGQLEPYKGIRTLISAWKEFIGEHSHATLEIIGTGSLEEEVRRATQSVRGIIYRGVIPHEKLATVMAGAWATIMPSLAYETFGMSAAESLAYGVPVIASRIGALLEIVRDNVNGLLVQPGDIFALQSALERLTTAPLQLATIQWMTPAQYGAALEKLAKG